MPAHFRDRVDAGRTLAHLLSAWAGRTDVIVLGLPRGGVPVAFEIARELQAPLDVFLVRKLGVPGHEELAMGAIATGGVRVLNPDVVGPLGIPDHAIERVTQQQQEELRRREVAYRGTRPVPDVRGKTVILVDDGLATGSTMRAAISALRQQGPERIIGASPVGAPSVCAELDRLVDRMICATMPEPFHAVGLWYDDFSETSDDEVRELLARAESFAPPLPPIVGSSATAG